MAKTSLRTGDQVKLSAHGLKLKGPERDQYKGAWQKAVKRNEKDTYEVLEICPADRYDSVTWVRLGFRSSFWFWRRKGPLTLRWVNRDWVKKA